MPPLRPSLWIGFACASAGACAGTLDDVQQCTLIGCVGNVTIDVPEDRMPAYEEVRTAAISVCRNEVCLKGVFDLPAEQPAAGPFSSTHLVDGRFSGEPFELATVVSVSPGKVSLHIEWIDEAGEAREGDVYKVILTSVQGTNLATLTAPPPAYSTSTPNGPGCGPVCRSAEIRF